MNENTVATVVPSEDYFVRLDAALKESVEQELKNRPFDVAVTDTIGILIANQNRTIRCLLTGKVVGNSENNNIVRIYIFDLACSNRNTYALIDSVKIKPYDTIEYDLRKCFRLNYGPEPQEIMEISHWRKYIKEKYNK